MVRQRGDGRRPRHATRDVLDVHDLIRGGHARAQPGGRAAHGRPDQPKDLGSDAGSAGEVAEAVDAGEPQDGQVEPVRPRIRPQQLLTGDLAGAIDATPTADGRILGQRPELRLGEVVDADRAGMDEPGNASQADGFGNVDRAHDIDLEPAVGDDLGRITDERCRVDDDVGLDGIDRLDHRGQIAQVAAKDRDIPARDPPDVVDPGAGIKERWLMPAVDQGPGGMTADHARTGDENPCHPSSPSGVAAIRDNARMFDPELPGADNAGERERLVLVAVDAAGAGGSRAYTYHVPDRLNALVAGEAVIVGFGRRQVLGIILGDASRPAGVETRPILDRVRADGPLVPPLTLNFARWIADTYLAPPAVVLRSILPPGMLERFELIAEVRPEAAAASLRGDLDDAEMSLVDALGAGPRRVRDLGAGDGRAGLVRRLRAMAGLGLVDLDWTLEATGPGPRRERWVHPVDPALPGGAGPPGRPLGPRQRALLSDLAAAGAAGLAAVHLAARHGEGAIAGLARRGLVQVALRERPRRPLAGRAAGLRGGRPASAGLTPAQSEALAAIAAALAAAGSMPPILLDGVTGGGKTAVYTEAIALSLALGRPALLLVPEIALALPLVDRLRADLDATVAMVHSGLSDGERTDEWRRIRAGDVDVVVGTRLALTSPLAAIGLIVVDEEHDPAYKSDRTPRLQARDAAVELGRLAGAAVVLGSATPAVESIGHAATGRYRRVTLPARPVGAAPVVEVVDLRLELHEGNRGLLSRRLAESIAALDPAAGDQAILMINRRGTASAVLCRDCGEVQVCPDCERPLVYHQAGMTLRCHHCGRAAPMATRCPKCRSARIRYLGGGTERVEREVQETFTGLRVGRLDRDVVERRGAAERVVDAFSDGRLDVLVGTSLVAKGLDLPGVILVGVVSADIALNLPDERASERTFQLLTQVVGRAGRGERAGLAIIQTYQPQHPVIEAVRDRDAAGFYAAELELRRRFGSPPFGRLVKLTVALPERAAAEQEAERMAGVLRERAAARSARVDVMGPAPAYIARRADRWRWNVVLRGQDPVALLDASVEAPWSVDVDPESLL